MEFKIFDSWY